MFSPQPTSEAMAMHVFVSNTTDTMAVRSVHPPDFTMIGGVFVYNHKGEVLISRVYRDNVT